MVDHISLTAAEIAFLMSTRSTVAPPLAATLGLNEADFTDAVYSAGLGSLLLRQLAIPLQTNEVDLAAPLAAIAEALTSPLTLVQISLVANEGAEGSILVESAPVRFLIAPRLFRCYDLSGLDQAVDVREPLVEIADAFLRQYQPAVATFAIATPAGPVGAASIAVGEDGTWQTASGQAEADEARESLRAELGRILPQTQPSGNPG
jgi:hypothetical protein